MKAALMLDCLSRYRLTALIGLKSLNLVVQSK